MPLVRDVIHSLMRDQAMTTVYGNPGSTELGFLHDWPDDFRYILALEEAAAVAMADGHAQISGRPVVVNLHAAAGIGNAMGSIVTAYHQRTPLILLAGQQTRRLLPHQPFLATLDPTQFGRPYVKWADQPARPDDVPAAFARAIQIASQPPCGPVLLSIPNDDWEHSTTGTTATALTAIAPSAPHPAAVTALADQLRAAASVAFVAGPAVDQDAAVHDLIELADRVDAHVWASPMSARCSFPETHARFAGHLPASPAPLADALRHYQLVVVFGAPVFTYHVDSEATAALPPTVLLHDDEHVLARAPAGVSGIPTTMKPAIAALTELLPARTTTAPPTPLIIRTAPEAAANGAMTAATALHVLHSAIPDNAIVVEEIPSHRAQMHLHLPISVTHAGFLTTGSGVLGYGLPAAIGAAIAAPARPVVALIGDGSLMYRPQALHTAVATQANLLVIIFDNHGYGALKAMSHNGGYRRVPGLNITGIQYTELARSLGCNALTITEPAALDAAVIDASAAAGPTVLHVPVAPSTPDL